MDRRADWRMRLAHYLAAVKRRPFEWGALDCALFAAGAVEAQTGLDLGRGLRGYASERAGLRAVRAAGFADHVDVFARALPASTRLRVGDVAVIEEGGRRALGIVQGRGIYAMQATGLAFLDREISVEGFSV